MTLTTTEELKHLASSDNASELTRRLARECLANREAQPVAGELGVIREESVLELNRENIPGLGTWYVQLRIGASHDEILARVYGATPGETTARARMLASMRARPQPSITDEVIDRIVVPLSHEGLDEEKHHCEWHLYHDRERIRKELREYFTAPPAPAAPGIDELRLTFERSERESDDGFNLHKYGIGYADEATQARWESWLSCRAAMLAQSVSGGYKLVPAEPTEDMIAAAMNCDDVSFNADETFCVNFGNIYAAMLAAAPEGGNG